MSIFSTPRSTARQDRIAMGQSHPTEFRGPTSESIAAQGAVREGAVAVLDRSPPTPLRSEKVLARRADPIREAQLKEYAELAELIGISPPDLVLEAFKDFLRQKDWGVFPLAEVVSYMDKKAAAESKDKAGWHWRPLREKDHVAAAVFGTEGQRFQNRSGGEIIVTTPASDLYFGPRKLSESERAQFGGNHPGIPVIWPSQQHPYDKTIPLHALRKVAAIEREFKAGPVAFFVCDYAPAPQIEYPDPFLMALIDNPKLNIGIGRFIIDFWDEPGFGIRQMLGV